MEKSLSTVTDTKSAELWLNETVKAHFAKITKDLTEENISSIKTPN